MGMVLMLGAFVGGLVGLALSVALALLAVRAMRRPRDGGAPGWGTFGLAAAVLLVALNFAVAALPLPEARPGSDYDIAMLNLTLLAFGHALTLGLALILASRVAGRRAARRRPPIA